jgi:transcriptional regulator with XRE-family HTH domain
MVRLRVKEILQQKGMSMGKLSRASDVSFNTIRRVCNDPSYSPTLNTLVSIAKALNVSVSDLYEEIPDDPPTT